MKLSPVSIWQWLLRVLVAYPKTRTVAVSPDEREPVAFEGLAGKAVDLVLPETVALKRRTKLPAGSRRKYREIAALEIMRKVPFSRDEVYLAHRMEPSGSSLSEVTSWLVPANRIADCLTDLTRAGAILRTLRLATDDDAGLPCLIDNRRAILSSRRHAAIASAVLSVIAAALCLWLMTAEIRSLAAFRNALVLERSTAHDTLFTLRDEIARLERDRDEALTFEARLNRSVEPVVILSRLTAGLPDTAWLSEFNAVPGSFTVAGVASSPIPEIVLGLQDVPEFRNVELTGAVTFDARTDGQRFELQGEIAGPAR